MRAFFEKVLGFDHGRLLVDRECSLVIRGRLSRVLILVRFGLVRLMMANGAPRCGPELTMAGHMSRDPADYGSLDTAFGFRCSAGNECDCCYASQGKDPFHD
jgi:hypothetical protein